MKITKIIISILLLVCITSYAAAEVLDVSFPAAFGGGINAVRIDFDETWFYKDSDTYNHNLARLSLCMAVAAFRSETTTYNNSDSNIRKFLDGADFRGYEAQQFEMIPTENTIASVIAHRPLADGSTLIAVAVSGQGYRKEWMSNFAVGGDDTHAGFRNAAAIVFERLEDYIARYEIKGKIRVWTSGFSRAAATANLFAAKVLQSGLTEDNCVFAYTYGTPSTTKTPIAYPQIYNICNSFDPVAFIPFKNWMYGKHGITLYLPAAEVDLDYNDKLSAAREAFRKITGTATGFNSNINANWLLSKIMELLYHMLPESSFYSSEFQQILIDTYAAEGSAIEKIDFLFEKVKENEDLSKVFAERSAGVGTLAAEGLYTAYMEIAGRRSGRWADLFTGAIQLVHEHEPSIYLAWLMSTDVPKQLFDHPLSYTRMILSGDFIMTVLDENGEEIIGKSFSKFSLNNQVYYAFPDGNYTVTLRADEDTEGIIAFKYNDIRRVSEELYETEKMHFFEDEVITVSIQRGGDYSVRLGDVDIRIKDVANSGMTTIAGELALTGSNGVAEVKSLAASLIAAVIPHVITILLIFLYFFSMLVYKLVARHRNEIVETHALGRWLLVLVAAACMVSAGRHLYNFIVEYLKGTPDLENHTAVRAAELLGYGTLVYQMTDVLLYTMLSWLAWRGRNRHRSRVRGRRLSGILFVMKLWLVIGAGIAGTLSYYDIACAVFFLMCFIAFIIVRDGKYERMMKRKQKEFREKRKEARRLARAR